MTQVMDVTIDGIDSDEHYVEAHYRRVSRIMSDLGYDNDLMNLVAPRPGSDLPDGVAITPEFSKPIRDTIQKCQIPFTLDTELDGCFGDGAGSANTTTVFEKTGMALQEALEILDMTGQLETAFELIENRRSESDAPASDILTYAMATLSKGWVAEKLLNDTERFKTGSVSQDQGGLDLYDTETGDWVQLKPATTAASNDGTLKQKEQKHMIYMWTGDGKLKVTDIDGWKDMKNAESDKTGLAGTLLVKSATLAATRDYGRTFRYLWW